MLTIRVTRGKDADDGLTCVRADGTSTWERRKPGFGVMHDLIHLAVESTLGLEHGFYGLVNAGWSIPSFAEPGTAARLPPEAVWVENVVGGLQSNTWGTGARDVDAFNDGLREAACGHDAASRRLLTAPELDEIRRIMATLHRDWDGLAPGESMAWQFDPGVSAPPIRCSSGREPA